MGARERNCGLIQYELLSFHHMYHHMHWARTEFNHIFLVCRTSISEIQTGNLMLASALVRRMIFDPIR